MQATHIEDAIFKLHLFGVGEKQLYLHASPRTQYFGESGIFSENHL